jgi:DNA-binding CsgD family transcriptional regulator
LFIVELSALGRSRRDDPIIGRAWERAELDRLVTEATSGKAGVVVLRGEAGIGKSRLLESVTSAATGVATVRLVGIESEMRLGFAALHQLLAPWLADIDTLPTPQRRALNGAFGIADECAPNQYLVSLAALTLVTGVAAARGPLMVVVDDAQWLDRESAFALGFVGRRLRADRVCLFVASRNSAHEYDAFDGLPSISLGPLGESESVALLNRTVNQPMSERVRTRLLADGHGNPLALVEFGRALTPDQLAGHSPLPDLLAVDRTLEAHYGRQISALAPPTQALLLVLAAEPTGDARIVWRAGQDLNFDDGAIAEAQAAGLLTHGSALEFRHPLIRSAVYQGASPADRRRVHAALAAACEEARQPDQRAWHRAAATHLPDDDVADDLEVAAARAAARGGAAASAALLARSADLTPDADRRAIRYLAAASADMSSGSVASARSNLTRAVPDLADPLLVARARQLEGSIAFLVSDGTSRDGLSMIIDAARALAARDVRLARDVMLDAIVMTRILGDSSPVSLVEVARLTQSFTLPAGTEPTTVDLVLDAIAELFSAGVRSATPLLRQALGRVQSDAEFGRVPRNLSRACYLPLALSDSNALRSIATACIEACRELGDFRVLMEPLYYLALNELSIGSLDTAADVLAEQREVQETLQRNSRPCESLEVILAAWRGLESETRHMADLVARSSGLGVVQLHTAHALIVLELGLGNYHAAAELIRHDWSDDISPLGALRAADAVEANVRCGNYEGSSDAVRYLDDRAGANGSDLDRGLLARCHALTSQHDGVEAQFRESIALLERHGGALHVARSQLVFGEWLRRQKRRRDAREQLESAVALFDSAGAAAFADRARVELRATGALARKRVDSTRHDLTPQEWQIARMAADGATNAEIGARLFISANTVDYHLRKVFRKLDISTRHEIARVLATD